MIDAITSAAEARRARRWRALVVVSVAAAVLAADPGVADAAPSFRVPADYNVARRALLAKDVVHLALRSKSGPGQVVHVARVGTGANARVVPVLSSGNENGKGPRLEPTSALCKRAGCIAAVNGSFFDGGRPLGGILIDGEPVVPSSKNRRQVLIDEESRLGSSGQLKMRGTVMATDLSQLTVHGVNASRGADRLILYTPRYGTRTRTGAAGAEAIVKLIEPDGPIRVGQTSVGRIMSVRDKTGRTQIPRDGVVLSAHGKARTALLRLWQRIEAGEASRDVLIRLDASPGAWDSLAGKPVLVRNGKPAFPRSSAAFVNARHPRTIIGRTGAGDILLVTVDGRQKGRAGMSLAEAARLMIRLGAVEAVNLDGGGSTTFVVRGRAVNKPSGGAQRKVAAALAIVPGPRRAAGPSVPPLSTIQLPPTKAASPAPAAPDAIAARPAVVAALPAASSDPSAAGTALALAVALVPFSFAAGRWRRRRRLLASRAA